MSFLSFLGFGRRAPLSRPPAQRMYIVDATGLVNNRARNGNGQPSPRDHYMALRNLAQFAGHERLALAAVFIGRPLREAGEGGEYKGVKVYYTENAEAQANRMMQLIRDNIRARDVVLISGDADLEREAVALNASCLRLSTLRKAMDEREDRGDRDNRDNNDRPFRSNRGRPPGSRREPERDERVPESDRRIEYDRRPEPERRSEPERRPEPAAQSPVSRPAPAPAPAEQDKPEPGVLDLIDPV